MELAIALAVPFFFVLIFAEVAFNLWRVGESRYTLADTLNNLACGIGQQLVAIFAKTLKVFFYALLFDHLAPGRWPINGWTIVAAIVLYDLCYYAFHRAGHRVNLVWAGHAVHHQSEEMNLSVALRQSWFVQCVAWVFYLPLALIGMPPELLAIGSLVITLYQFPIHTEVVGKLWGPLEWLLNTPSHHRVHHGTNPRYLDANYGGVLIVWDRLFGTFVPEEEEVVYGTVAPLRSWNPLWANLYYVVGTLRLALAAPRWRDKLYALFAPPEWRPAALGGAVTAPEVSRETQRKYAIAVSRRAQAYAALQFAPVLVVSTLLLGFHGELGSRLTLAVVVWVLWSLQSIGAFSEASPWAKSIEVARLVAAPVLARSVGLSLGAEAAWLVGGGVWALWSGAALLVLGPLGAVSGASAAKAPGGAGGGEAVVAAGESERASAGSDVAGAGPGERADAAAVGLGERADAAATGASAAGGNAGPAGPVVTGGTS